MAHIVESQRTGTARSFFTGKVGFMPTILSADLIAHAAVEGQAAPLRFLSWKETRAFTMWVGARRATGRYEWHPFLTDTLMFVTAGEIDERISGLRADEDDGADGNDSRLAAECVKSELWWGVQLARPLERSSSHGRWRGPELD